MRCVVAALAFTVLLSLTVSTSSADGKTAKCVGKQLRTTQSQATSTRTFQTFGSGILFGLYRGTGLFGTNFNRFVIPVAITIERLLKDPNQPPLEDPTPPHEMDPRRYVDLDEDPWEEIK